MHLRYAYKAGATTQEIRTDLMNLFTGTITDKNLLSGSCVKVDTEIITETQPGWELWDDLGGGYFVVRAPCEDGITHKYVKIGDGAQGATPNLSNLIFAGFEYWNPTTHVGTNKTIAGVSDQVTTDLSVGGEIYAFISARTMVIWSRIAHAWTNNIWFVLEHTRDEPWDTPERGQPCWGTSDRNFLTYTGSTSPSSLFKPRQMFAGVGGNSDQNQFTLRATGPYEAKQMNAGDEPHLYHSLPRGMVRDADLNICIPACNIQVNYRSTGHTTIGDGACTIGGQLHDIKGTIYDSTTYRLFVNDEVDIEGNTYVIVRNPLSASANILVPKF